MPAETPSPSPLTPEERYEVDALLARHEAAAARTYGEPIQPSAWRRLLSERDSLAARVSHLEARLERAGQRVIDAIPRQCTNEPDMHGDWCRNLGHAAPVPEDKKESAP